MHIFLPSQNVVHVVATGPYKVNMMVESSASVPLSPCFQEQYILNPMIFF